MTFLVTPRDALAAPAHHEEVAERTTCSSFTRLPLQTPEMSRNKSKPTGKEKEREREVFCQGLRRRGETWRDGDTVVRSRRNFYVTLLRFYFIPLRAWRRTARKLSARNKRTGEGGPSLSGDASFKERGENRCKRFPLIDHQLFLFRNFVT